MNWIALFVNVLTIETNNSISTYMLPVSNEIVSRCHVLQLVSLHVLFRRLSSAEKLFSSCIEFSNFTGGFQRCWGGPQNSWNCFTGPFLYLELIRVHTLRNFQSLLVEEDVFNMTDKNEDINLQNPGQVVEDTHDTGKNASKHRPSKGKGSGKKSSTRTEIDKSLVAIAGPRLSGSATVQHPNFAEGKSTPESSSAPMNIPKLCMPGRLRPWPQ